MGACKYMPSSYSAFCARTMNVSYRLLDLVGVLAVDVNDRIRPAVDGAVSLGERSVSSMIVISHTPTLSIDRLSRIPQLTRAGAAGIVVPIVEQNSLDGQPSTIDLRGVSLRLISTGSRTRDKVLAFRRDKLASLIKYVSAHVVSTREPRAAVVGSRTGDALLPPRTYNCCDEWDVPGVSITGGRVLASIFQRQ